MQQFLEAGLASSTKKVYTAGWNRYCKFTNLYSISLSPITMIEKVTLFVAFLGTQGLAVSTICFFITTVSLHIKVSKMDQFRQGSTAALGSTRADICPAAAIVDYLQFRDVPFSRWKMVKHYTENCSPRKSNRHYIYPWQVLIHRCLMATAFA